MGAEYPVLRYPGNITGSDNVQPGSMLGWDEVGRPYEVIDTEFIPDRVDVDYDGSGYVAEAGHTNVYLQYATPETLRAFAEKNGGLPAAMVATAAGLR
jgi:hypothetical protein